MKIRSISELIRCKLDAAAQARWAYAMAAAEGDTRVANRCKNNHAQLLRQVRILWEMSAHRY